MTPWLILWVLFAHFVGDFVLQPRSIARVKSKSNGALCAHCLIIFVNLAFGAGIGEVHQVFAFAAINASVHAMIDRGLWKLYNNRARKRGTGFHWWNDQVFYVTIGLDQFLHTGLIILTLKWLA